MLEFLLVGLVGLALGSFLNVVITRLPRGEPFWMGRSRCLHCRAALPWYDNIPLLSYFLRCGRCRFCGAAIPRRYTLVELSGGVLALALWSSFPPGLPLLAYGLFSLTLLALSVIDLEQGRLPDAITLPGVILGLLFSLILPQPSFLEAATGALLGGAVLAGIAWVYAKGTGRQGLGGGDVKLLAMIGAFLGVSALPAVLFLSAGSGTLAGFILVWVGRGNREGSWRDLRLPYGPFLCLAALIYLLVGEQLYDVWGGWW